MSRSSASSRRSFERLEWWLVTRSDPRIALSSRAVRSATLRVLTKTIVLRWARTRSALDAWISPHDSCESVGVSGDPGSWTESSSLRRWPSSTSVQVRPGPTRKSATALSGFCVADRPMRWRGAADGSRSASTRSSVSARCAPRFDPIIAWISSTTTARTVRRRSRPLLDVVRM